jgi:protein O-GlcNAc transferase
VLFDDYKDRKFYHGVEAFAEPVALIGRMARFELQPRAFPAHDFTRIFDFFTRPN